MSARIEEDNLGRAAAALACVKAVQGQGWRKDYLNAVEGFPFAVRSLGLGQALALLRARDSEGYRRLFQNLQTWLCQNSGRSPYHGKGHDLLAAVTAGSPADYRAALVETEAYLGWLKPFAQALLGGQDGTTKTDTTADASAL